MSVYRRDSKDGPRWLCDFIVAGTRVNETMPGVRTKREAQAAEAKLKAEYRTRAAGSNGSLVRMSLQTAIERYVHERLRPKSRNPENLATYLSYLGLIQEHFGAAAAIEAIDKAAVAGWWAALLRGSPAQSPAKGTAQAPRKPVKANTAKRYLTVLKALLRFAKEAGAGNEVPTFAPKIPDDSRIRWLTHEEEESLLAASPGWLRDLIVFYVETGARQSDALKLTWRYVSLPEPPARGSVTFIKTKEDTPRGVPLSRRAREVLTRLRTDRPGAKPDDRVFLWPDGVNGALVPVGDFKKTWGAVKRAAGVEDLHGHDLRHTFASRLVMKRVPMIEVQKLLGHSSLKMTSRYAHLAPEALDSAISALD